MRNDKFAAALQYTNSIQLGFVLELRVYQGQRPQVCVNVTKRFPLAIRRTVQYYLSPLNLQRVVCEIGLFGRFQAVEVRVQSVETKIPHCRASDLLNDTVEWSCRRAAAAAVHVRRRLMMVVEFLLLAVSSAATGRHF